MSGVPGSAPEPGYVVARSSAEPRALLDPAEGPWDIAGLESRVHPRRDPKGRSTGWTAEAVLPWPALAAKAPPGVAVPPRPGDRWRFNVFRIERPGGPKEPEKDALYLAWSPTGQASFHVPQAFRELVFTGP